MSVTTTLLTGAVASIGKAIAALESVGELDTYDYEAEGKLSAVELTLALLRMAHEDTERMLDVARDARG